MNKAIFDWSHIWSSLGKQLKSRPDRIELARLRSIQQNAWFTAEHIDYAYDGICNQYLNESFLKVWLSNYELIQHAKPRSVGIICAGNIPMVGFHDIMCTITTGNVARVKLSHKDLFLLPAIFEELISLFPELKPYIVFVNKLTDYDSVIATGSNNSLRYFNSYFGHVPHLFRHNRTSISIIQSTDGQVELDALSDDIFLHFGLGCRNVSKLFIPRGFDLEILFTATLKYSNYVLHSKYNNNFIYHTALFQMNKVEYLTNDLFILLESDEWHSPLSVIYCAYYDNLDELESKITPHLDIIQVVYSSRALDFTPVCALGTGQKPSLWDYADHVDTMNWLLDLDHTPKVVSS